MASLSKDAGWFKRIVVTGADGKRRPIRLGKVTTRVAERTLTHLEALETACGTRTPIEPETAKWLATLPERTYARLVRARLVPARKSIDALTVGGLIERFVGAAVVKDGTLAAYRQTTESLKSFLGEATPLENVSTSDADGWYSAISASKLASATVSKRVRVAKLIFGKAVRWGLIPASPFADMRAGPQVNLERAFYVSMEATTAILAACPDQQWRIIVGLCRFAGLRCPSEILTLRWGDIAWDRNRMTVRSPKTEGHEGKAERSVPIVPALRTLLLTAFESAEAGEEYVVTRVRDPRANMRTTFEKIIRRAGLTPWPRLFQNLRASCETDLAERFPAHVVAAWLGHSPTVAARHYLQLRDAHFELATGGKQVAQNPAQLSPIKGSGVVVQHAKSVREITIRVRQWARQDSNLRPHPL